MKETFHVSVVIGVALAEMKAAQGQTEQGQTDNAHGQEVDISPRRARFGISIRGM